MVTVLRAFAAALGWFAVALQYWLVISGDIGPDPVNRTINFFSYFTILTNILAALAMTAPLLAPGSSIGGFFDRPAVRTAIATYIIVVGVIYHLVLRDLWDPQGWQWIADMSLHYVTPVLFVVDWLLFVPKHSVPWRAALAALAYPLIYMGWTLWHGSWSGFYPYPFVDVTQLGLDKVLVNAGGMTAAFLVLCLVLIAVGRVLGLLTGARAETV
ncbi:Pr6Pr family membrane protein [Hyphomicrobium sp.]|uniref:Pr6Pr family membrane protein n=1 Tax=Hyphomicrobium sp. TaxID=82 RepID=UPI0025C31C8C|nr:Pr6Pr family membrane protein [Hyphomicrobium sp.]MCC7251712.1 Pr6Pr family membrane protein [Hyphomicrobium sp.]